MTALRFKLVEKKVFVEVHVKEKHLSEIQLRCCIGSVKKGAENKNKEKLLKVICKKES